jgi:exopolysaccharide production protein ExoZ
MSRVYNVQSLRGLAALSVVIGHAYSLKLVTVPTWLATCGYSGVDLFFAISGFIICQTVTRTRQAGSPARQALIFLARRYWRIYSLYWVGLAAVVLTLSVTLLPRAPCDQPAWRYVLLMSTGNCFIPPAWTLPFELYFYTVVAVLVALVPRHIYHSVAVLMLMQVAVVIISGSAYDDTSFWTSPLILEFGVGCAVARLAQAGFRRWPTQALAAGAAIFALGTIYAMNIDPAPPAPLPRALTFGLGGALILYALVTLEEGGRLILPAFTQRLGDASYSLYLWHWPLVMLGVKLALGWYSVVAIVGWSFASYHLVEKPLLSVLDQAIAGRRRPANAPTHGGLGV